MARGRESFFELLFILPWWVAVVAGVVGYGLMLFVLPLFWSDPTIESNAVAVAHRIGSLWVVLCLAAAGISAIRSVIVAHKFDHQRGIDDIRSLSWRQFEAIAGEAFRRRGYAVLENATDGADGGIDLVLRKDGEKFCVQCKQWKARTVGVKPVRELAGVISAADAAGGFFVTAGTYTDEARSFAKRAGIELIDGPALERMVREAQTPEPYIEPTSSGMRATTTWSHGEDVPLCPTCGSAMVGRTAKRGPFAGQQFWGCSQYPNCRGMREI